MRLRLEFRPLLVCGMLAETPEGTVILIDKEQHPYQQTRTIWHEVLHLLFQAAGKTQPSEQQIELLAAKLADVCPDFATALKEAT